MPEPITTDKTDDTETESTTDQSQDTTDWKAEAEKWKALSRKNEERANANADKAKRFDEIEEASKSELERERAAREKAEKALAERTQADERIQIRDKVAAAKGIPASILKGSTEEEFTAHADELIAAGIKPAAGPSSDGQGDVGDQVSTDGEKSAEEIVAEVAGG